MVTRVLCCTLLAAVAAPAAAAPPAKQTRLKISFPEGMSSRQMTDRVAQVRLIAIRTRQVTPLLTGAAYAAALTQTPPPAAFAPYMQGRNLEGFLFPSTYVFGPSTRAPELIALQLRAFAAAWKTLDLSEAEVRGLNPYEVLNVASMVEREAVVPAERPLIAAVIYNRLAQNMPLGIDATLRYGLGIPGTRPLTAAELQSDSPYNTRRFPGLPPTPISNPGLPSMDAAAHPAAVDYLYYLRIPGTLTHYFTDSYSDFCAKVHAYGYGSC